MEDVFKSNREFILSKRENLSVLTGCLYSDIATRYRHTYRSTPSPYEIAGIYRDLLSLHSEVCVSPDFALFCKAFSDVFGSIYTAPRDTEKDNSPPKIAYLQNTFSDRAYMNFSSRFERVSAVYYPGFSEICEEVYNGGCTYAMLPVYNSSNGQLVSFRRLILKYDLKISLVTDIETPDESSMRFALLQKGIDSTMMKNRSCLDLFMVLDSCDYAPFLSACHELGAEVLMMNSLPLEYSDDRQGLSLQLDIANSDRNALLCFLEASHIRYDIAGFYDVV